MDAKAVVFEANWNLVIPNPFPERGIYGYANEFAYNAWLIFKEAGHEFDISEVDIWTKDILKTEYWV